MFHFVAQKMVYRTILVYHVPFVFMYTTLVLSCPLPPATHPSLLLGINFADLFSFSLLFEIQSPSFTCNCPLLLQYIILMKEIRSSYVHSTFKQTLPPIPPSTFIASWEFFISCSKYKLAAKWPHQRKEPCDRKHKFLWLIHSVKFLMT